VYDDIGSSLVAPTVWSSAIDLPEYRPAVICIYPIVFRGRRGQCGPMVLGFIRRLFQVELAQLEDAYIHILPRVSQDKSP
jgi:hypothetical protein